MTLVLIITMAACEGKEQSTGEVNGAENPSAYDNIKAAGIHGKDTLKSVFGGQDT